MDDTSAVFLVSEVDKLSQPQPSEPPRAFHEPPRVRSFWTRTKKGTTSFGLPVRIALTAAIAGAFFAVAFMLGLSLNGGPIAMVYVGFTLPGSILLLKDIWKRERKVEDIPRRTCRVCKAGMRHDDESCFRCGAAA